MRDDANKNFQVINNGYSSKNFLMIKIKSYYLVYDFLRSRFVGKDRYIGIQLHWLSQYNFVPVDKHHQYKGLHRFVRLKNNELKYNRITSISSWILLVIILRVKPTRSVLQHFYRFTTFWYKRFASYAIRRTRM